MNGPSTGRSIQEFWIDFLLEEEFGCDPAFAAAFASACEMPLDATLPVNVIHSVNDEFGEADLVVLFRLLESQETGALLIENKITAAFQPDQALRYRSRGEKGVTDGIWSTYRTVLVAPERYIRPGHGFDHAIALESIGQWICRSDMRRRTYKLARLARRSRKRMPRASRSSMRR